MSSWWREMLFGGFDAILIGFAIGTGWPALSLVLTCGGLITFGVGGAIGLSQIGDRRD